MRPARRAKTSSSSVVPVAAIDSCARSAQVVVGESVVTATPTIGQLSSPRRSSRYSAWNVILRARSPVIPKITSASAS